MEERTVQNKETDFRIVIAAVSLLLANSACAFDMGNMMNPSKWMDNDNDDDYYDDGPGYGYPATVVRVMAVVPATVARVMAVIPATVARVMAPRVMVETPVTVARVMAVVPATVARATVVVPATGHRLMVVVQHTAHLAQIPEKQKSGS
jgi:hypothetical protein